MFSVAYCAVVYGTIMNLGHSYTISLPKNVGKLVYKFPSAACSSSRKLLGDLETLFDGAYYTMWFLINLWIVVWVVGNYIAIVHLFFICFNKRAWYNHFKSVRQIRKTMPSYSLWAVLAQYMCLMWGCIWLSFRSIIDHT